MSVTSAATLIGLVVLAVAYLDALGLPLAIIAWLLTYGALRLGMRVALALVGDPADVYAHERATLPRPRAFAKSGKSATRPRLLRSHMARFASRLPRRRRWRP